MLLFLFCIKVLEEGLGKLLSRRFPRKNMEKVELFWLLNEYERRLHGICEDAAGYLLSLRKLTVSYIDRTAGLDAGSAEVLCRRYIAALFEASRTPLPGRLAGLVTSVSDLCQKAAALPGGDYLDFSDKAGLLASCCLEVSEKIVTFHDSTIPAYLARLTDAVENLQTRLFTYDLPRAFVAGIDALRFQSGPKA